MKNAVICFIISWTNFVLLQEAWHETSSGPIFCLLLRVSSDYAKLITGQVTEVTCLVIGRAQPELTPSKRQKMGPEGIWQDLHWFITWQKFTIGYFSCIFLKIKILIFEAVVVCCGFKVHFVSGFCQCSVLFKIILVLIIFLFAITYYISWSDMRYEWLYYSVTHASVIGNGSTFPVNRSYIPFVLTYQWLLGF